MFEPSRSYLQGLFGLMFFFCLFTFRDGCRFLRSKPDLLVALFALTSDPSVAIVKDCYRILINLSADETLHQVRWWVSTWRCWGMGIGWCHVLGLVLIRCWWLMSKFFQCCWRTLWIKTTCCLIRFVPSCPTWPAMRRPARLCSRWHI